MTEANPNPSTSNETVDPELQQYHSPENFFRTHKAQFESMKLPTSLWRKVYDKIYTAEDDVVDNFTLQYVEEGEEAGFRLVCKKEGGLKKESDVWVIEHAWTTSEELAKSQLLSHENLMTRMWKMMDLDRRLQQEEHELQHGREAKERDRTPTEHAAASAASTESKSSGSTSSDTAVSNEQVEMVMEHTGTNKDVAAGALMQANGDLLQAINIVNDATDAETRQQLAQLYLDSSKDASSKLSTPLLPDSSSSSGSSSSSSSAAESSTAAATGPGGVKLTTLDQLTLVSNQEYKVTRNGVTKLAKDLTPEEKADIVIEKMKEYGYADVYHVMKPRAPGVTGPVKPEEVQMIIFVLDEIGAAVRYAQSGYNVNIEKLVVITQGGAAVSLMWPSRDIEEGEAIYRPVPPSPWA